MDTLPIVYSRIPKHHIYDSSATLHVIRKPCVSKRSKKGGGERKRRDGRKSKSLLAWGKG